MAPDHEQLMDYGEGIGHEMMAEMCERKQKECADIRRKSASIFFPITAAVIMAVMGWLGSCASQQIKINEDFRTINANQMAVNVRQDEKLMRAESERAAIQTRMDADVREIKTDIKRLIAIVGKDK